MSKPTYAVIMGGDKALNHETGEFRVIIVNPRNEGARWQGFTLNGDGMGERHAKVLNLFRTFNLEQAQYARRLIERCVRDWENIVLPNDWVGVSRRIIPLIESIPGYSSPGAKALQAVTNGNQAITSQAT